MGATDMKTLWEWFTGGKAVPVRTSDGYSTEPVVKITGPIPSTYTKVVMAPPRDLLAEIAEAKAKFMAERAAQKAALVGPRGKYRIRQRYVDHVASWVVEQWEVWEHPGQRANTQTYYAAAARAHFYRDFDSVAEMHEAQKAELRGWEHAGDPVWTHGDAKPKRTLAAIRWLPLSPPGSPFRTRKEAQAWLRDWVHPDHCAQEGVLYGADGERMKDPKS